MLDWRTRYTVESVRAGHPDKVCDQISDAILDACLAQDPLSRVAVEAFGGHGVIVIGGEITTSGYVDVRSVASGVMTRIGYKENIGVVSNIVAQSPEIAAGVDQGGAGDQGIMYGYATRETEHYLPKGVVLVHEIVRRIDMMLDSGELPWLRPDGKAQVTISDGAVETIVVSVQHSDVDAAVISKAIHEQVLAPLNIDATTVLVNPAGSFTQGGFAADTGLTGRKIMVDTYGGLVPHGGGCFSGKDATKVDRSGAYMARFAAKNIVASGIADECLVSVAYAIGKAEPVMLRATAGDGKDISTALNGFDFRPAAIIERLDLRRPIFEKTAVYGHFGRPATWEVLQP